MEKLAKKQIEDYKKLCYKRDHDRLLTPDDLRGQQYGSGGNRKTLAGMSGPYACI